MSEDLAVDVGLTRDSSDFKKFVDGVDSILEYGCTSVTRVVQDIVDKCHTSELDIARQVIRACASPTSNKRQNKLKWWETYQRTMSSTRQPRDQQRRPRDQQRRRRSMSPLFQRPRSPTSKRCLSPRSGQFGRPHPYEQNRSHKHRPMHLSFERPTSVRSRDTYNRDDRDYDDNLRREEKRKRTMSPLFDPDSDVPTWPRSKRRRQQ